MEAGVTTGDRVSLVTNLLQPVELLLIAHLWGVSVVCRYNHCRGA